MTQVISTSCPSGYASGSKHFYPPSTKAVPNSSPGLLKHVHSPVINRCNASGKMLTFHYSFHHSISSNMYSVRFLFHFLPTVLCGIYFTSFSPLDFLNKPRKSFGLANGEKPSWNNFVQSHSQETTEALKDLFTRTLENVLGPF